MLITEHISGQPSHWSYSLNLPGEAGEYQETESHGNWSEGTITWEMSPHYQNMLEAHSNAENGMRWKDDWFDSSIEKIEV